MPRRADRGSSHPPGPGEPVKPRLEAERWTGLSPRLLRIAKGIHVVPGPHGGWEVRTLGADRMRRRFATFSEALSAALAVQREDGADVIVHHHHQGCRRIKILEAEPVPEARDD